MPRVNLMTGRMGRGDKLAHSYTVNYHLMVPLQLAQSLDSVPWNVKGTLFVQEKDLVQFPHLRVKGDSDQRMFLSSTDVVFTTFTT